MAAAVKYTITKRFFVSDPPDGIPRRTVNIGETFEVTAATGAWLEQHRLGVAGDAPQEAETATDAAPEAEEAPEPQGGNEAAPEPPQRPARRRRKARGS